MSSAQDTTNTPDDTLQNELRKLKDEFKVQLEAVRSERDAFKQSSDDYKERADAEAAVGVQRRQDLVNTRIRSFFEKLMAEEESLTSHKVEMDNMLTNLPLRPETEGLLNTLACVASRHDASVVQLEAALAAKREAEEVNAKLRKELKIQDTPMFGAAAQTTVDCKASASTSATSNAPPAKRQRGLGGANPDLWKELCSGRGEGNQPIKFTRSFRENWNEQQLRKSS
jgi:hypothetical protein